MFETGAVSTPWGVLAGTVSLIGLAFLRTRALPAIVAGSLCGAAVAAWTWLWIMLAARAGEFATIVVPANAGWSAVALFNVGLATLAWVPIGATVFILRYWTPFGRNLFTRYGGLWAAGPIWCASMIVPELGQAGRWPPESLSLVCWVFFLAMVLGRMTTSSLEASTLEKQLGT